MWFISTTPEARGPKIPHMARNGYSIDDSIHNQVDYLDLSTWIIWSNTFVDILVKGVNFKLGLSSELASRVRAVHTRVQLIEPVRQKYFHLPYQRGEVPSLWRRIHPAIVEFIFLEERRRFLPEPPPEVFRRRYTVLKGAWIREMEKPDECVRTVRLAPTPGLMSEGGDWQIPTSQAVVDHYGVINLNGSDSFVSDAIFEVLRPHLDPTAMYIGRLEDLKLKPARRRKTS